MTQPMQLGCAADGWYCPATQLVHAEAEAPEYCPTTQPVQLEDDMLPVRPKEVPTGQLMQAVIPVLDWYCPAKQAIHAEVPVPAANVPAAQ